MQQAKPRLNWGRITLRLPLCLVHLMWGVLLAKTLLPRPTEKLQGHHWCLIRWWYTRLLKLLGIYYVANGHPATGKVLLASNHISWLDILIIGSASPAVFVAGARMRGWPIIGWLTARSGTIFITRGAHQTNQVASEISNRLEADQPVLIFPEATTSNGLQLKTFHARLFAAAINSQSMIQPIALHYANPHSDAYLVDCSFLTNLLHTLSRVKITATMSFLTPFEANGHSRKVLANEAKSSIASQVIP